MQWLESNLLDGGSCLDRSLCHLLCLDPSHALPCRWATLVRKYVCCLGVMVYTSILTVFLGVGSLLGYCSYNLYKIWPSDDPETNKNIFQVFFLLFFTFIAEFCSWTGRQRSSTTSWSRRTLGWRSPPSLGSSFLLLSASSSSFGRGSELPLPWLSRCWFNYTCILRSVATNQGS